MIDGEMLCVSMVIFGPVMTATIQVYNNRTHTHVRAHTCMRTRTQIQTYTHAHRERERERKREREREREQIWGQFHFVNSNSTQFHLVNSNSTSNLSIPIFSIPFFSDSLPNIFYHEQTLRVPTWNTYSEQFIFQVGLSWKKYF